jgi:hypothetical protein
MPMSPVTRRIAPPAEITPAPTSPFAPENLITIEEMARRLRPDVPQEKGIAWVREKTRRRSPNPIPAYNLGRHLMFDWILVSEWIRNTSRPIHSAHRRRKSATKLKVAAKAA